jgi:hypothetical protein
MTVTITVTVTTNTTSKDRERRRERERERERERIRNIKEDKTRGVPLIVLSYLLDYYLRSFSSHCLAR